MKRVFLILIAAFLLVTSVDTFGQRWKLRRYEMDIYLAGVSFHGDIGLADRPLANMFNGIRPSLGVRPRYFLRNDLAVSLDLGYLMYGGKDKDLEHGVGRNLTFNTQAFQHFVRVEYYLLGEPRRSTGGIYNRRGMVNNYNRIYLYLFGGAGGIYFNAKVKDLNHNGEEPVWNPGYDNSKHYTAAFPFGGGVKLTLDPRWAIGAEIGYQFCLTDYLDGYNSEWSDYKDSYYLTSFKVIYMLRNDRKNRPIFTRYYR